MQSIRHAIKLPSNLQKETIIIDIDTKRIARTKIHHSGPRIPLNNTILLVIFHELPILLKRACSLRAPHISLFSIALTHARRESVTAEQHQRIQMGQRFDGGTETCRTTNWFHVRVRIDIVHIVEMQN